MQDRVPLYPGRVKLTPVAGRENTYDMVREDQPTQVGTPLNKDSLLKDTTAALFGLGADAVPDEVLLKISELLSSLESEQTSHAIGNFTASVTLPFTPDAVWVASNVAQTLGTHDGSAMLYPNKSQAFWITGSTSDVVTWNGGTKITRAGSSTIRYVALKFGGVS